MVLLTSTAALVYTTSEKERIHEMPRDRIYINTIVYDITYCTAVRQEND